jgi:hypothetical protein
MSIFRHNAVLAEQKLLSDQPLVGKALRVKPSDGDALGDHGQAWRLFVDLDREGAGVVTVELWSSFDGRAWAKVAQVVSKSAAVVEFIELPAFAPYVQVRTVAAGAGERPAPKHRLSVRLASDGPFSVVPA